MILEGVLPGFTSRMGVRVESRESRKESAWSHPLPFRHNSSRNPSEPTPSRLALRFAHGTRGSPETRARDAGESGWVS